MRQGTVNPPPGFVEATAAGERPTFENPETADRMFIWPAPRFAAMAHLGGRVLLIETDDWARIDAFLAVVAAWRASNAGFLKRVARVGGHLTNDTPASLYDDRF